MRGVVLYGDETLDVVDLDPPEPGAGQAVVRVGANGICGSDLAAFRGQHATARFPKLFGHEVAGIVDGVGSEVDASWVGVHVVVEPNLRCGTCRFCLAGLTNLCPDYRTLGSGPDIPGGCAEQVVVPVENLHRLPDGVSSAVGSLVQPLAISFEGIVERGRVQSGQKVLVFGAGTIGLGVMLFARLEGAEVTMVDLVDSRLARASDLGAEHVLRGDDPALRERILDATAGFGVDVAVEAVGGRQTATVRDAVALTAGRGTVVVLGSFPAGGTEVDLADVKRRELHLVGSSGHPGTFSPVIAHLESGRLDPEPLLSHRLGLEDVGEAFAMLGEGREGVLKLVIEP